MLRSFALAPDNAATQEEILRLARATGRWEEAIRVEGHLFALAETLPEKLEIARNAAYLVEHEVKDLVRAFRAYLNAFRLAPDDSEIVGHLWRLAARSARYHDYRARRRRRPTPPARRGAAKQPAADTMTPGHRAPEPKTTSDIWRRRLTPTRPPRSTRRLAPSGRRRARTAPTRCDDDAAQRDAPRAVAVDRPDPNIERRDPRRRRRRRRAGAADDEDADVIEELDAELLEVTPPPQPRRARPPAPPPPPTAPELDRGRQPFATPWEELADAYDALPAEDVDTRRVYLRKIVEVWERGQKDIDRALDALERAFRLDIKDAEMRTELERIGGAVRPLGPRRRDLPGRDRRVRPDRHRGGAAPRRRPPARAARTDRQGGGAVRRRSCA